MEEFKRSPSPQVSYVSRPMKTLPFLPNDPLLWLMHLESQFSAARISSQRQRYDFLSAELPISVLNDVRDIILNPPEDRPYDALRAAILERTSVSDEKRIRQLLGGVSLGDLKPTQLLRQMRQLVSGISVDDILLRQLWMQQLPENVQCTLAALTEDVPLEKLAATADRILEYATPSVCSVSSDPLPSSSHSSSSASDAIISQLIARLDALHTDVRRLQSARDHRRSHPSLRRRSSSRRPRARTPPSNSPDSSWCWFHQQYRENARQCKPGCTFKKSQGNPPASK